MLFLQDKPGQEARVGESCGYWLEEDDFLISSTGEDAAQFSPWTLGKHGFPHRWPEVYSESRALKRLIGKRGTIAGIKAHVVAAPGDAELAQVDNLSLQPLQSFWNAEQVCSKLGFPIVKGWAVYEVYRPSNTSTSDEDLDGGVFIAQKHWFNRAHDGHELDFTPRLASANATEDAPASGISLPPLLLVEGNFVATKTQRILTTKMVKLWAAVATIRGYRCKLPLERPSNREKRQPEALSVGLEPCSALPRATPPSTKPLPRKQAIDYSKFDNIIDSDDEHQSSGRVTSVGASLSTQGVELQMLRPAQRLERTHSSLVSQEDYVAVFEALITKAEGQLHKEEQRGARGGAGREGLVLWPDLPAMFTAFKNCLGTTDRALLDQACHAAEGLPVKMSNGGDFEAWIHSTSQLAEAMLRQSRHDECRMWCVIRRMRMPQDADPLQTHACCLEDQLQRLMSSAAGSSKVAMPCRGGPSKLVTLKEYSDAIQVAMRAQLRELLYLDSCTASMAAGAYAGLSASLERTGDVAAAREIGRQAVKHGYWHTEWQRPAHFVRDLLPKQEWHDDLASAASLRQALEEAFPRIREEFEAYVSDGHELMEVGMRSGQAFLLSQGSWTELPLVANGRMDYAVCGKFPETARVLTEKCADAIGLAFHGGGDIAFRVLQPGTKLKPHCGPTNARLTCVMGLKVPLGAEPGISVGQQPPRPWCEGKCLIFDDSYEYSEELDEMAEGDCLCLLLHFWHPSFKYKHDSEWKTRGMVFGHAAKE